MVGASRETQAHQAQNCQKSLVCLLAPSRERGAGVYPPPTVPHLLAPAAATSFRAGDSLAAAAPLSSQAGVLGCGDRAGAASERVAPADDAARVTSRQEEPLRASAWPASPTNSGAQRRRGRERWPSGQVKARGQRGVAAATRLRPELRSHRLSSRWQIISLRGGDGGAAESGGLPGRRA